MIVVVLENTIPLCFAIHVIACFTLAAAALPCPTPPFATRMYVMSVMCRWFGTLASNSRSTRSVPPSVPWGFRRHQDLLRLTPWHARFTCNASHMVADDSGRIPALHNQLSARLPAPAYVHAGICAVVDDATCHGLMAGGQATWRP